MGPVAWVLGSLVSVLASRLPWGVGWALGSHSPVPAPGGSRYSLLILSFSPPPPSSHLWTLWLYDPVQTPRCAGVSQRRLSKSLPCAEGSDHENQFEVGTEDVSGHQWWPLIVTGGATVRSKAFAVYTEDILSCDPASCSPGLRGPQLRGCARVGR